jgi:hypothetical protein
VAFIEELTWRLGAIRRGKTLVIAGDPAIELTVRGTVAIRTTIPALDGAALTVRVGDSGLPPDAETGDAAFDRAWHVVTDAPELASIVLTQPARIALDATRTTDHGPVETAVQVSLRDGELEVLRHDGDQSIPRAIAAVDVVRAIARRPAEIRDEIAGSVTSLGGRNTSTEWTWRSGFASTVPCGRVGSVLEQRLEAGRSTVRLVAEGSVDVAWGEIRRRDLADGLAAWRTSAIEGMVVAGDATTFVDVAAIADIAPSSIVVGTPERAPRRHGPTVVQMLPSGQALVVDPVTGRYAVIDGDPKLVPASAPSGTTRCEIRWDGWLPPRPALQRAVRWLAATLDQVVPDSPYR